MTIVKLAKDYKDDNEGGVSDSGFLLRKLHGHFPVDLGEILEWGPVLGVHVLPAIDQVEDLEL